MDVRNDGGGSDKGPVMEQNRQITVNWGTFNVPTILSVLAILWYTATHSERQDSRLDSIETSRAASRVDYTKRIEALEMSDRRQDLLEQRITVNETNIVATNARIDRQTDVLQDIRSSIGALSTNFEVLSTKVENALPINKSELGTKPPAEYTARKLTAQ